MGSELVDPPDHPGLLAVHITLFLAPLLHSLLLWTMSGNFRPILMGFGRNRIGNVVSPEDPAAQPSG